MKAMSIIGIVWFTLCLLCIIAFINTNVMAAVGWGIFAIFYAIPYSIVGLVTTSKKETIETSKAIELIRLNELKEKGILSEAEFLNMKIEMLKR